VRSTYELKRASFVSEWLKSTRHTQGRV
jgi:hypothetical protein